MENEKNGKISKNNGHTIPIKLPNTIIQPHSPSGATFLAEHCEDFLFGEDSSNDFGGLLTLLIA